MLFYIIYKTIQYIFLMKYFARGILLRLHLRYSTPDHVQTNDSAARFLLSILTKSPICRCGHLSSAILRPSPRGHQELLVIHKLMERSCVTSTADIMLMDRQTFNLNINWYRESNVYSSNIWAFMGISADALYMSRIWAIASFSIYVSAAEVLMLTLQLPLRWYWSVDSFSLITELNISQNHYIMVMDVYSI